MTPPPFSLFVERILGVEGGYVRDPNDPGGETKWGISHRSYPHLNIQYLTKEQAISIYQADFWEKPRIKELPPGLAWLVLDFGVNAGVRRSVSLLQDCLGVTVDGVIGPLTLFAANGCDQGLIGAHFLARQLQFRTELPTWGAYSRGWCRRMAESGLYFVQLVTA